MSKEVFIFPYININKIIKMSDFEIHPFNNYKLEEELKKEEILFLNEFVNSFRKSLFNKWESPKKIEWIWILKYKWTILRTVDNSNGIWDKTKILFLLLKLHITHDFFNPWMNNINIKTFFISSFNTKTRRTVKFNSSWNIDTLYSTNPENINWLWNVKFYPIRYTINNIPIEFKIFWWTEEYFWMDKTIFDITGLFELIIKNSELYQKFLNLSSIHYWLEEQSDLFFYYSIIPSILEVLLFPLPHNKKKQFAVAYWDKLDKEIIKDNDFLNIITHQKKWKNISQKLWLIARTIIMIYDMRNDLLHEWKKSFNKMKIHHKWHELRIYDIFQLLFKYSILHDLIEKWVLKNDFIKLTFEWSMFTSWTIKIISQSNSLYMDEELNWLLEKAKSDKELDEK